MAEMEKEERALKRKLKALYKEDEVEMRKGKLEN